MSRLSLRFVEVVYEQPFGLFFILFWGDWHPKTEDSFKLPFFFLEGERSNLKKNTIAHPLYGVKL